MHNPLGIIAGTGDLPWKILEQCHRKNHPAHLIAFHGQTPLELTENQPHTWVYFGQIGKLLKTLKEKNIESLIFAGALKRPNLQDLSLDWEGVKFLKNISYHQLGDDGLLTEITRFFTKRGFNLISPTHFLETLVMPCGIFTDLHPNAQEMQDIQKGIRILQHLGPADVGQAIIVDHGQVLGIEAIEGTQGLIERVLPYKQNSPSIPSSGVLIKMTKPGQNLHVDLPTIGPETIHQASNSCLKGIAIEAQTCQVLEQAEVIRLCNQKGLFLYSFTV